MRETFDRVLARFAKHTGTELALKLGVVDSYVTKLRGGWRPVRVRGELWTRLRELDAPAPTANAAARADYYDGVLFAAQAMSETVTRLLSEARSGLRTGGSPESVPAEQRSPTAGDIAVGLQVMTTARARSSRGRGREA